MYEGIKAILNLMNKSCDKNGCNGKCPVFDECKTKNWSLLRKDLEQMGIDLQEVGLRE